MSAGEPSFASAAGLRTPGPSRSVVEDKPVTRPCGSSQERSLAGVVFSAALTENPA